MKKITFLLLVLLFSTGCNLPTSSQPPATPTTDAIATQVSLLLTTMPTATAPQPPATPTSAPSATQPAAATPTTEPTQTATATVPVETPPDWREQMDGGKAFYLYENDNTRVTLENGHLALTGLTADGWHGWSLTFSRQPTNFRIVAVMVPQSCSGSDLYGLVFRAPNASSGYFFGVTCDGRYNLHARNFEDGTDKILIELTQGSGIQQGSNVTNRLEVRAEGDRIGLYSNGSLLQEVIDSTFTSGYFGAFVAANQTSGFTVWMDEISLWNLP